VRFSSHTDLVAALERDGLDLGDGRKLCVTKWLELLSFPWHYKEKSGGSVGGGSGSHVDAANWGTPSTGKSPNHGIQVMHPESCDFCIRVGLVMSHLVVIDASTLYCRKKDRVRD